MRTPTDFALDTFEAALAMLCGAYEGAGLPRAEIRAALDRRLRVLTPPFDPARAPDGTEVYLSVGGPDARP